MMLKLNIEVSLIPIAELMRELLETHDADKLAEAIAEAVTSAADERALDAWAKERLEPGKTVIFGKRIE